MNARAVVEALRAVADPARAAHNVKYMKAEPGGYGEGDQFLGIKVPELRRVAKVHKNLPFTEIAKLVTSPFHEVRLTGFFVLIHRFRTRDKEQRGRAYEFCLEHMAGLNNWDLVDSSAHQIVGGWLWERDRTPLYALIESDSLWERRIAMIATYHFIKKEDHADALALAEILLGDSEDLMHKASGWMLREVGNRDGAAERRFLDQHCRVMPRTMLRYAIEKFPAEERKHYMDGGVG